MYSLKLLHVATEDVQEAPREEVGPGRLSLSAFVYPASVRCLCAADARVRLFIAMHIVTSIVSLSAACEACLYTAHALCLDHPGAFAGPGICRYLSALLGPYAPREPEADGRRLPGMGRMALHAGMVHLLD